MTVTHTPLSPGKFHARYIRPCHRYIGSIPAPPPHASNATCRRYKHTSSFLHSTTYGSLIQASTVLNRGQYLSFMSLLEKALREDYPGAKYSLVLVDSVLILWTARGNNSGLVYINVPRFKIIGIHCIPVEYRGKNTPREEYTDEELHELLEQSLSTKPTAPPNMDVVTGLKAPTTDRGTR